MLFKKREESKELKILTLLSRRMNLDEKDKQHYLNLQKGYEGELYFDSLTDQLESDCLNLNDLLLHFNSTFQIDTSIVLGDTIHIYEVKNFEGEFFYESNRLYTKSKLEIANPLIQLNRAASQLRQLLQSLNFTIKVVPHVVFVNPEFVLYQAPPNEPFIFPNMINRHLHTLSQSSSKLSKKEKLLAEKLVSLHMNESPFLQIPSYQYDQLKKGITCEECHSFEVYIEGHSCICTDCGCKESVSGAVMRSVREIRLLFPDRKITTHLVHDWCKIVGCKKRIRRTLQKHMNKISSSRWSYFN